MSERRDLATKVARFIRDNDLAQVFGGEVELRGRAYVVLFSQRRILDGMVRVFGAQFVQLKFDHRGYSESLVFGSVDDAIEYLRLAFVENDGEAASHVPTRAPAT